MSFVLIVFFRLFYLSGKSDLAMVSNNQSKYSVNLSTQRAYIYDCNMKPIVNTQNKYIASILPCPDAATTIADKIKNQEKKESILNKFKDRKPFSAILDSPNIYGDGIEVIQCKKRYSDIQMASHIIGYTDGSGQGVCGIEKEFDAFFRNHSNQIRADYIVPAKRNSFENCLPHIDFGDPQNKYGVVLTIDRYIQKISEDAASTIEKGAVVVMDPNTGELKAIVSRPNYDPNNVVPYLNDPNKSLINRAFSSYNVGSTFKLIVTAAALDQNYSKFINFQSTCIGHKDISGRTFHCHYAFGHGTIPLGKALEISCNPFFIDLACEVGPSNIIDICKGLGFSKPDIFATGIKTASGSLPDKNSLLNKANLANFGFGQGELLATPIQVAKMISLFANDGYSVVPKLINGFSDKTGSHIDVPRKNFSQTKIISTLTARTIKDFMISVVEHGSGKKAKPQSGGAGGKTASAQTGKLSSNDPQQEIIHAWFAGFYPAEKPKYTIVILVEGGDSGGDVAAPVFKKIADKLPLN